MFLASIWLLHGFAYYGIGHSWVNDNTHEDSKDWFNLIFANMSEIVTKLVIPLICIRTRKTVIPFATLFSFSGIVFLLMPLIELPKTFGSVTLLYQLCSVVNIASWNILWFLSPLAFPANVR